MRPSHSKPRARGMALIEIVAAVVLLGVALVAMLRLSGRALFTQTGGEEIQTAAALIDEQLNLVLARGPDNYGARYSTEGNCDAPFSNFQYSVDLSAGAGSEPYLVRVTVSWDSALGQRSETVEALIAPRPGENTDPFRAPDQTIDRQATQQ